MYPGTIFNWHDQSVIQNTPIEVVENSPLYLHVSSFDRGPEELMEVSGRQFYDLFGTKMNFSKHGQPALQAANMIDGGATLLIKRVVADDAKLANLILVSTVKRNIVAVETVDTDPNGRTINQILGNPDPEERTEYADVFDSFTSKVGVTDNGTVFTVSPALGEGNKYFWIATDDDVLPALDTVIDHNLYTEWSGTTDEVYIADGTQIKMLEVDAEYKIKRCGIVTVASKLPHPSTRSTDPTTSLSEARATSTEGLSVNTTTITISTAIDGGNTYFYSYNADMPEQDQIISQEDITANWIEFGSTQRKEITITADPPATPDGTALVFVEFVLVPGGGFQAVRGFNIDVCTKLEPDERENQGIQPINPDTVKYAISDSSSSIKWSAVSVENAITVNDVKSVAESLLNINDPVVIKTDMGININFESDYPLICCSDNGRGVSKKSIRITPDYSTSKDMNNMFFNVAIFDGSSIIEKIVCTLNPDATYNNVLYGFNQDSSIQLKFFNVENAFSKYIEAIADITSIDEATLLKYDLINATNNRGSGIPDIVLDPESINLNSSYGIELDKGDNGSFTDAPYGTEAWINAVVNVFNGKFDNSIWDVDTYKIAAIFDANYPVEVKDAIAKFVTFREDCVYFRDYGTDIYSYASIMQFHEDISAEYKNRYIADYYTTYQIYDPETKKRVRVTMLYDLSRAMVNHFINGCCRPVAGTANNMVLPNAIPGSINFTPRITPDVNQKSLLDDARINYAIFENNLCVVQSTYSSQPDFTQLSFINNTLAIQEVVRAVRVACPRQRYTFVTGIDFSSYATAVKEVLMKYSNNFAELTFEYEQDSLKASQKIFYATIYFRFNNWAQTESFELYALPNE